MAKKLDPLLVEILTKHGERVEDAVWDCHGTWVVYHKAIERIAAKAGVVFDLPQIIEANTAAKTVAIAVAGRMGDRSEWSFGEAAPSNNKNAYPYAMAEKRAKDRVVLKLVGLHGLAYSEEESDDFKVNRAPDGSAPTWKTSIDMAPDVVAARTEKPKRTVGFRQDGTRTAHSLRKEGVWQDFEADLKGCNTIADLTKVALHWSSHAEKDKWPDEWRSLAKDEINAYREAMLQVERVGAG